MILVCVTGREICAECGEEDQVKVSVVELPRHSLTSLSLSLASELEEALLVMPLSEMVDFLPLIDLWIQVWP